jgi:hypothetical protein
MLPQKRNTQAPAAKIKEVYILEDYDFTPENSTKTVEDDSWVGFEVIPFLKELAKNTEK